MLASDQLAMPTKYGVGLHQRRKLKETFPTDGFTFHGEATSLVVRQGNESSSDDGPVRIDLLAEKVDRLVVALVEPARESRNQERQRRNEALVHGSLGPKSGMIRALGSVPERLSACQR